MISSMFLGDLGLRPADQFSIFERTQWLSFMPVRRRRRISCIRLDRVPLLKSSKKLRPIMDVMLTTVRKLM